MAQKFYVDNNGVVLGSWDSGTDDDHPDIPAGAIEVSKPPSGRHIWNGNGWDVPPNNPIISFDDFEDRFTSEEWDDSTDFVYQVDTATGNPKRRALVQGLARAQARNSVDLSDNKTDVFLSVLVSGAVITEARKTAILTP